MFSRAVRRFDREVFMKDFSAEGRALGKGRMATSTIGVAARSLRGTDGVRVVWIVIGAEVGARIGAIWLRGTEDVLSFHAVYVLRG